MHTTVPAGLTRKQAELFAKLDPERLPQHIAVIMDGNGRWAQRRHLPRIAGHKRGVDAVRDVIKLASRIHLHALTLYAFSAENWKRPKTETSFLMALLRTYLKNEVPLMNDHNIQLRYIGRIHELAPEVQERMAWALEQTSKNTGMIMTLALNYGARAELIDAFQAIVQAAASNGGLEHLRIDEELVSRNLYSNLPDPDLVIRTSGEMRLSNFLLWQLAYTEIYVTPTLWPDFDGNHLLEALVDFQKRERRYGNVGAAV
ncbi:MAG TPA: isoprenyl transferase [Candidatus Saccharimonadales bacterium]|nr:isoprenyl transferase [Candidatus Saccharimonadales bacterium]